MPLAVRRLAAGGVLRPILASSGGQLARAWCEFPARATRWVAPIRDGPSRP